MPSMHQKQRKQLRDSLARHQARAKNALKDSMARQQKLKDALGVETEESEYEKRMRLMKQRDES